VLTEEDFDAVLGRCHRGTLICLVGADEARDAPTKGLTPAVPAEGAPDDPTVPSYLGSRPGCVYLNRPAGKAAPDRPWAVVVDAARLDPDAFVVDEAAYFGEVMWSSSRQYEPRMPPDGELPPSVISRIGCNTSLDNGRPTAGEWIASIAPDLDTSDQVRRCFEETDRVAYRAAVPSWAVVTTFEVHGEPDAWTTPPY
jgi:hypothetical protein